MTTFATPDDGSITEVETTDPAAEAATAGSLEFPAAAFELDLSASLRSAYVEVSQALAGFEQLGYEPTVSSLDIEPGGDLAQLGLVLGVGIGRSESADDLNAAPGSPSLHLYTAQPVATETAIGYAASALGVQALSDGSVPVRAIHTGPIDALSHRFHMRPAPGGVSIGHQDISAGTLGCLATGRSGERANRLLVLSNNHLLANVNAANSGAPILQPGPYDGGVLPTHRIGALEKFVRIDFGNPNYVDCATAWVDEGDVRPELVYLKGGSSDFFSVGSTPKPAKVGMTVGKSGRTTQLTSGRVEAVGVNVNVNMGGGRIAHFEDQISIRGVQGDFRRGGDSGSLVWEWTEERSPVGLLFAGGGAYTFANDISRVLDALDIDLYT